MSRTRRPVSERFWEKVDKTDGGCWLWTASIAKNGYGQFMLSKGHPVRVHRWAYEALVGPIPDGLHIDHLCRVRHCVNPDHLEAVTQAENTLRGVGICGSERVRVTHCPSGHEYTEANTYRDPKGARRCRACARQRAALQYARQRAEAAA